MSGQVLTSQLGKRILSSLVLFKTFKWNVHYAVLETPSILVVSYVGKNCCAAENNLGNPGSLLFICIISLFEIQNAIKKSSKEDKKTVKRQWMWYSSCKVFITVNNNVITRVEGYTSILTPGVISYYIIFNLFIFHPSLNAEQQSKQSVVYKQKNNFEWEKWC